MTSVSLYGPAYEVVRLHKRMVAAHKAYQEALDAAVSAGERLAEGMKAGGHGSILIDDWVLSRSGGGIAAQQILTASSAYREVEDEPELEV